MEGNQRLGGLSEHSENHQKVDEKAGGEKKKDSNLFATLARPPKEKGTMKRSKLRERRRRRER